jgi:hypothetical protein
MAGPAFHFRLFLFAACLGPACLLAEASAPAHLVGEAAPSAPTSATEPNASPKLAKLFAGAPPKFDPPKSDSAASVRETAPIATETPRNGIVRLPTYIVRGDTRLPDEYQILTPKGRDAAMALRYMGPQNQLDHALNAFTLADLWKSIPVLGKVPFVPFDSKTYNERAALIYERPELKRRINELMNVEHTAQELEKSASPDK